MPIPEMQELKKRYPVYVNIDDEKLLDAVINKYPVYQKIRDRIEQKKQSAQVNRETLSEGLSNISGDFGRVAVKAVGGIERALPVGTKAGIENIPRTIPLSEGLQAYEGIGRYGGTE